MDKLKREEQAMKSEMKNISKMRRLSKEINNEFNNINFSLENITTKIEYLKAIETEYNKSISEKILLLIEDLKMLDSDYLRDN